jgi:hypothetical protein
MSTDTTRALGAQPTDAPAFPGFDPSNPAHQQAWQALLNMGRDDTKQEPNGRAVEHFDSALALYMGARRNLILDHQAETDDDERERVTDQLIDAITAAEDFVMGYEAPDWRAVLAKLEIATYGARHPATGHMEAVKGDIMRLASLDRSPTFLPLEWLDGFERAGGRTSLVQQEEGRVAVLSAPTSSARANRMLRDLEDHERAAIGEHLLRYLDPADHGLTVEA